MLLKRLFPTEKYPPGKGPLPFLSLQLVSAANGRSERLL